MLHPMWSNHECLKPCMAFSTLCKNDKSVMTREVNGMHMASVSVIILSKYVLKEHQAHTRQCRAMSWMASNASRSRDRTDESSETMRWRVTDMPICLSSSCEQVNSLPRQSTHNRRSCPRSLKRQRNFGDSVEKLRSDTAVCPGPAHIGIASQKPKGHREQTYPAEASPGTSHRGEIHTCHRLTKASTSESTAVGSSTDQRCNSLPRSTA